MSWEKETADYLLTFKEAKDGPELLLTSKAKGRHRAVYRQFNLLDQDGRVVATPSINEKAALLIAEQLKTLGSANAFNIWAEDLKAGKILPKKLLTADPAEVRHQLTPKEQSFTATGAKLAKHWPIFHKLKETGYGSIIRATLTLHQVCSSHCNFCSTIARNKKDSITLEEAKEFVEKLYTDQAAFNREKFPLYNQEYQKLNRTDIRLRGLILSGGGQPNLWPHFPAFVDWLSGLDIDLGLITNGFPRPVPEEIYRHFKWIRLSITPEDASPFYIGGKFNQQYIPEFLKHNPDITLGLSYVFGPWTTDDIILRLKDAVENWGFTYCRFLADCNLTRNAQIKAHQDLAERLYRLGLLDAQGNPLGRIFHQLKYHGTKEEALGLWDNGQCFLQSYNVFWDTTGHEDKGESFCYPCDSVTVLAEEESEGNINAAERKFNAEKWGTVSNKAVEKLYQEPLRPFFDPRQNCAACLFMRNNKTVKELLNIGDYNSLKIDPNLEHENFP